MLHSSTIIELTSSPEPEVNVMARRPAVVSESASSAQSAAKVKPKRHAKTRQKAKLSPTRVKVPQKIMGPVIELTDSDDEEPGSTARVSMHPPQAPRAVIELDDSDADERIQPRLRAQVQTTPRANAVASGSGLGANVRTPTKRARETSPAGQRPQKRVLRTLGGDVAVVRDADAHDEETEEELEGYDPHFADKPFPFDFLSQAAPGGMAGPSRLPPHSPTGIPRRNLAGWPNPHRPAADNGIRVTPVPQPAAAPPNLPPTARPPWVDHALRWFRNANPPPASPPPDLPDAPDGDYMRREHATAPPAAAPNELEIAPPAPTARPSSPPPPPLGLLSPHIRPTGDLAAAATAQILDVVPDIDRAHLAQLVAAQLPEHGANTPAHVLAALFDGGVWPREGDGDVTADAQLEGRVDVGGWLAGHPGGSGTGRKNQGKRRARDFDEDVEEKLRPKKRVRCDAARADGQSAGTSLGITPAPKITPHDLGGGDANAAHITSKDKGKGRAFPEPDDAGDDPGIECQCCFGEYPFDTMVQCPEAHLFCAPCVEAYAGTQLGLQRSALLCMHASGCARPFPAAQLSRALPAASLALWERLTQADEIARAGLTGLAECPFCEWKCVLDEEDGEGAGEGAAGRFWCGNRDKCGVISCRKCKKSDHAPKTCDEAEADKHLDGRHTIEEAMTAALMRNCPKCKKAFIKDEGCNKMTCPTCRTLSCYVCRAVITGYEHFDQTPRGHASTSRANAGKCRLWDNVEERHADEVRAAAAEATAAYKRAHPDAVEAEIAVEVPIAAVPAVRSARGGMWRGLGGMLGRVLAPLPAMPLRAADPLHDVFPVLRMFQQPIPMGYGLDAGMWGAGLPPPPQLQQMQPPVNPFDMALGGHVGLMRLHAEQQHRAEEFAAQQRAQLAAAPPPFGFHPFPVLHPAAAPAAVHVAPAPAPAIVRRREARLPVRAAPLAAAEVAVPALVRPAQAWRTMRPEPPVAAAAGPVGAGMGGRAGSGAAGQQQRARQRVLELRRVQDLQVQHQAQEVQHARILTKAQARAQRAP